jgi:hypothetical protein
MHEKIQSQIVHIHLNYQLEHFEVIEQPLFSSDCKDIYLYLFNTLILYED